MFAPFAARGMALRVKSLTSKYWQPAQCDEAADDGGFSDDGFSGKSESAPPAKRFASPFLFENLGGQLRQGSVNNYDGFRVIVQKQVNLNTIASHFYWVGSQSAPPIYQYRLIIPFEDKQVNVATDMDFNIECELRAPLGKGMSGKTTFSINEQQGNNLSVDVDLVDESSATQAVYSPQGNVFSLSYMQSLNKWIVLGGQGEYAGNKSTLELSFGGIYDDHENVFGVQWDKTVSKNWGLYMYSLTLTDRCLSHTYLPGDFSCGAPGSSVMHTSTEGPSIV